MLPKEGDAAIHIFTTLKKLEVHDKFKLIVAFNFWRIRYLRIPQELLKNSSYNCNLSNLSTKWENVVHWLDKNLITATCLKTRTSGVPHISSYLDISKIG